jgi:SanA protein
MQRKSFRKVWNFCLRICLLGVLGLLLPRLITMVRSWSQIYEVGNAPVERVALIFGAGLRRDGSPTPILRDRVTTGVRLYFDGKVEKLLMSGDNSVDYYNEPEAMRQYALSMGVPAEDIVLDYAGRRTYDSCYRAQAIFGVKRALLVTQRFHLPRALFLCNALGLEASGVEANNLNYRKSSLFIWNFREALATAAAFFDLYVDKPIPVLGMPEPIFVD